MKLVYVHDENNVEVLTEVVTNHSMSVEDILDLTDFDLNAWADGEDYDYNALQVRA
ncbi:hypothetical protein [Lysinibacillus sp. BPa_S21]|uniref:hypothetical protein n=1 Tax=Lysinibacillus sp. BPa_S21 TaxID=2932478 RepID=UPI002012091D|nr:hypothetical protein [Lysinibacillus sp. BPa_S21]MCL1696286.1 hypothetical protein [Lysinibacillus sp. BPa_S21]